jgi:hypothetical protein
MLVRNQRHTCGQEPTARWVGNQRHTCGQEPTAPGSGTNRTVGSAGVAPAK